MKITSTQAIGYLIAAVNKVKFPDAMDAANLVLTFEELLNQLSNEEAVSSATLIDGEFGTANDGGFLLSSPPLMRRLYFASPPGGIKKLPPRSSQNSGLTQYLVCR